MWIDQLQCRGMCELGKYWLSSRSILNRLTASWIAHSDRNGFHPQITSTLKLQLSYYSCYHIILIIIFVINYNGWTRFVFTIVGNVPWTCDLNYYQSSGYYQWDVSYYPELAGVQERDAIGKQKSHEGFTGTFPCFAMSEVISYMN